MSVTEAPTDPAPIYGPTATVGGFDRNPTRFLSRELSWLAFNARVLALAGDPELPLLERAKFLAIFAGNLDEFFQVRVAGLADQRAAGIVSTGPDGRSPERQLGAVRSVVTELIAEQNRVLLDEVVPGLGAAGIELIQFADVTPDEAAAMSAMFDERVSPILTPLAVDPGHPFPYISDLSLNLAVVVRHPTTGGRHFARVKVPDTLPRYVHVPGRSAYVRLEDLIAVHLDRLFVGMDVVEHHVFRVTRNADLILEEEEADDLLSAVEMELRRRRFGRAVRLEIRSDISSEVRRRLIRELDLDESDVYEIDGPLDHTGLWQLTGLDRSDLLFPRFNGVADADLTDGGRPADIFTLLRDRDLLLHHPYTSFTASVGEFVRQAANDPAVLAIKMTLYRTAGESPLIENLIAAAESGKQVAVMIELKARFDEANNITWARRLEQAGVHVTYGLVGLKTHAKICMVVRDEPDGMRRYVHLGTGNYNHRTARTYEDLGLLTADPTIGADVSTLVNALTGYGRGLQLHSLLMAPYALRSGIVALIANEATYGPQGRIVMKVNSLVDQETIDALYAASQAGVQIDLIIRGICCLRPGVEGLSENIRVRSIIGRYLEHSRVYAFANGDGPGAHVYLLGSADLMERNLDRRVETLVRIGDPALQERLQHIFDRCLADERLAWTLDGEGTWSLRPRLDTVSCQELFQVDAIARAAAPPASGIG